MCSHSNNELTVWTNLDCSDCWMKPIFRVSTERYIRILANVCYKELKTCPLPSHQARFLDLILLMTVESRRFFLSEIPNTSLELSPDISRHFLTIVCTTFPESANGLIWCSRLLYNTFDYYEAVFDKKNTFLSECKVCFVSYPDWALLECGHSLCKECLDKVETCPFCRRDIFFHVESIDLKELMETSKKKHVIYQTKRIPIVDFLMEHTFTLEYTENILDFLSSEEKIDFFYKCLANSLDIIPLTKEGIMVCFKEFMKINPPPFEDVLLFLSTCKVNKKEWDIDLMDCIASVFDKDQIHALQMLSLGCYYTT